MILIQKWIQNNRTSERINADVLMTTCIKKYMLTTSCQVELTALHIPQQYS